MGGLLAWLAWLAGLGEDERCRERSIIVVVGEGEKLADDANSSLHARSLAGPRQEKTRDASNEVHVALERVATLASQATPTFH